MVENRPLKPIPVPDYEEYRKDICSRYSLTLPLKTVPFSKQGNLSIIPPPLDQSQKGWPWTEESPVKYVETAGLSKITVVIPSYLQGRYIEETIRSVILQNYPATELIVMDGGSTDETVKVLSHYKDFVSIAISEKDRGQSHAINKGFSVASGDLYYWVNSDDYLDANVFNRIVPYFEADKHLDILYGHGLTLETDKLYLDYAPLARERYLRFGGIAFSHSVIWRRQAHCPVWEDLGCAMDAELWLRLFTNRKSRHAKLIIGIARKHPEQKTLSAAWAQKWADDFEKYIWKYYPPISQRAWKYRQLEYRLVQKLFKMMNPFPYEQGSK